MRLKTYLNKLVKIASEDNYMTDIESETLPTEVISLIGKLQADIFNNIGDIEDILNK